jgi:GNAT superfamily N-acetyltransferase
MNQISSRIYENKKDVRIILDLIASSRPPEHLNDYPRPVDIEENLAIATIRANTRLWFDGEQPVGWAYVDEFNNLRWETGHPYEELLGSEIVKWGEACIRKTLAAGESATLDASCQADYSKRIWFLKQHGFHQTNDVTIHMMRPLSQPIPEPELPPRFIIRPIAGTSEAEAVAKMHRAAFGTPYMTTENRLALMNTSEYEASLDLVIVAPEGIIVANCICSVNEEQKTGSTDPLATHPHYRRRGLARALLLSGMRLLKQRGMKTAHLGTSGGNIAMQKVAESVGFRAEYKTIWFSKGVC